MSLWTLASGEESVGDLLHNERYQHVTALRLLYESNQSHDRHRERFASIEFTSIALVLACPFLILMSASSMTSATSDVSRSSRKPRYALGKP